MKKIKRNFLLWTGCLLGLAVGSTANADTFIVNNANDTGIDSLRWAIEQANQNFGPDQIVFASSYTIQPLTNLPPLSDTSGGTTIDGGNNTIIIDGSGAEYLAYGLRTASPNNALTNLHVRSIKRPPPFHGSGGYGIEILGNHNTVFGCKIYLNDNVGIRLGGGYPPYEGAKYNKIQACYIGSADGVTAGEGNTNGILLEINSDYNVIGVDGDGINDEYEGNVISGNVGTYGIQNNGTETTIAGNLIGTDKTGSVALPNISNFIYIIASSGDKTVIGTNGDGVSDALEGNIIAGNITTGNGGTVTLRNGTRFSGNYVGVDITGTRVISNSSKWGVAFGGGNVLIGTNSDGVSDELERNVISGNSTGIGVPYGYTPSPNENVRIAGNYIGTDVTGTIALGNGQSGIGVSGAGNIIIGTNSDGINDAVEANVISANRYGVTILGNLGSGGVRVTGNLIGTDKTGTVALPNVTGVYLSVTSNNVIGTNGDGVGDEVEGNVIVAGVSVQFNDNHALKSSENNTVAGNFIGTDVTGTVLLGKGGGFEMYAAHNNTIGTNGDGISDELEGNVFAGMQNGINIQKSNNNQFSGNYVGLGADGLTPLGVVNSGFVLGGSTGNIIGTNGDGLSDAIEGNIILANGGVYNGIRLTSSSNHNRIAGNIIGTNLRGDLVSGFRDAGVNVSGADYNQIGTNWDGVSDELEANIITNNGLYPRGLNINNGIVIRSGQYNAIRGNSIYNNRGQGIDLLDGANQGIATPIIAAAVYVTGGVAVSGTAVAGSTVEIYTTDLAYGDGEGKTFVGKTVAVGGSFSTIVNGIYFDDLITATATDTDGNTSEFSKSTTTSGNQPPVLSPIGDQSIDEMEALFFTVTAADPENESLAITVVNLPEGAFFDGAFFSWIPDYTQAGSYQITFTTSDSVGGSDSETITITVNAVNAPPASAPAGGGTYKVLTDISLSGQVSDYDGEIIFYGWFEAESQYCAGQIETMTGGEAVDLPPCIIPEGLPVGSHTITLEVSDGFNLPVSSSISIEVIDTDAPTLAPQADRNILWPPNHFMEEISIVTNAKDESGCYTIDAQVFSNEPEDGLGDGDTGPDFTTPVVDVESGTVTLSLRAERAGKGDGRVYSVEITATDCSGNRSSAIVEISCPHDRKGNN